MTLTVIFAVAARVENISVFELYGQLVYHEQRQELRGKEYVVANATTRGCGGFPGRGGFGHNGGGPSHSCGGFGHDRGTHNGGEKNCMECQLYGKKGHTVLRCWKRFDQNFTGEEKSASAAVASYDVDTNWYADSEATDHIIGDLEKLIAQDKYLGNDQVHTTSGLGMRIDQIGHTVIHTPSRDLSLNNILYVPDSSKNLVSVHRFTRDNHVFLELHPWHFLIKDWATRRVLHHSIVERGLYPLISLEKQALAITTRWHCRLRHPSLQIVQCVLGQNKLHASNKVVDGEVCGPCQQGKAHQLSYLKSSSVSTTPLELIFSDVWGPAPESSGRKKFYVSFIDDFFKFVWIYTIKHKSKVLERFHDFQSLVERLFDQKVLTMQTDTEGGEYHKLNTFFQCIGISHRVSCPHAHQQNGSAKRKHRHIVEVGLTLLAQASMLLKFFDDAFTMSKWVLLSLLRHLCY
jgi:hypothetical protein